MTGIPPVVEWTTLVRSDSELGERPVWDARTGTVVWVDILTGTVHRSAPPTEGRPGPWADTTVQVGAVVGAVALREGGGLVAAADSAFLMLDARGRPDADPVVVDLPPGQRVNDAACDPAGRLLAGTTSVSGAPGGGVLWSLTADRRHATLLEGVTESNGLDWSGDGAVLYYVDSGEPVVRRYAYDVADGRLGPRLADLAVLGPDEGVPDGLVVDSEGAVWVALWQGGAVHRYAPDGSLLGRVDLPVDQPTCPCFAGPRLDLLVVTTAWEGLAPGARAAQPLAGSLLGTASSSTGRLPHRFAEPR